VDCLKILSAVELWVPPIGVEVAVTILFGASPRAIVILKACCSIRDAEVVHADGLYDALDDLAERVLRERDRTHRERSGSAARQYRGVTSDGPHTCN
jgi:hypothetical protein